MTSSYFFGALTIVFIVLKLLNKIDWPWIWVLSPIWLTVVVTVIVVSITYIIIWLGGKYYWW